ncbi:hypothetical protein [Pseudovibrio ascidiaceicola]|uniref:hypothetical protein n=1 Tax=Pseudovibrio ascidiaceicola TaxID=285279 RepID=UPI000A95E786|nr:hypothetical protein [Pseudovibrio ascidiaceicola]
MEEPSGARDFICERQQAAQRSGRWATSSCKKAKRRSKPKSTPSRANRLGEILQKMFNLSVQWKIRIDNPTQGFHKRTENACVRFLSFNEINRLPKALENSKDKRGADVIRLCPLTGSHLCEVRFTHFAQFNLELLTWFKPATYTKQKRSHRLPISPEVADLVARRHLSYQNPAPGGFRETFQTNPFMKCDVIGKAS